MITPAEEAALRRAVELAARGAATVLPNPVVGCVLLAPGGWVVGEGFHERPGGPHAEVVALEMAGPLARSATAVVTLEPCNHHGRTGPCSEALVKGGVARVVVAVRDPWPPAAGGIETLRRRGVDVEDLNGDPEAEDVNRVWLGAMRLERPYVTWKVGSTIDGRVAAADGTSRWITSPESRADVHELRARVDTIMVGVGTVLADDPKLTARGGAERQPLRVVMDRHGRTPPRARVLDDAAETWISKLGPDEVLDVLWERGRRHVLLEGGPHLAASFLGRGLVDEVLVYLAPKLLGAGPSILEGGVATLADAYQAELVDAVRLGQDVRLRYRYRSSRVV